MPDVWTNPIDRVLRELISPAIWNADLAANLRLLGAHTHTGAPGDGAILDPTLSGATNWLIPTNTEAPATTVLVTANNQVRFFRFFLPYKLSVGFLSLEITTAVGGSTTGLGLYSNDGTTRLCFGTASSAAIGIKRMSVTPVILNIGFYLLAWTSTAAAVQARVFAEAAAGLLADTNAHEGTAANSSAAGVLPTSLGALSALTTNIPKVKIEGS